MGSNSGAFSLRSGYVLVLSTSLVSQDINSNTSVIAWSLGISGPTGSFRLNVDSTWAVNIDGATASGSFSYDFRSTTSKALGSGYITIPHNADGTVSYTAAASANANSPLGTASTSYGESLPTIPRASTATFAPTPMVANSPVTISTNRHSTSFTHTISYSFGSQSGVIATGIGDSQSWTPPLSLLTEIPNAMSGAGILTTQTYSGSTLIGTSTTPFTLQVPTGVLPTIGSVTATEAVAAIATGVGVCVQGLSKLALAIVGATGAYGSTISSYKLQVDAQTINAQSGTTGFIASAGTLTVIGTVTDSRGQIGTLTTTIVVLPYSVPTISTNVLTVQRAFADGTLNDQGTYIKIGLNAAATSLLNGTEKNAIHYRISAREYGQTVYVTEATATPGGITFSGSALIGTFDIAHSWDVLIEVYDNYATTAVTRTVATAAIFQHWDASVGMGIGKYRENGMLDVLGAIYQNNGHPVIDTGMLASDAEAIAGTDAAKPVTPRALTAAINARGPQRGIVDPAWLLGLPSVTLDGSGTVLTNVHYGDFVPKAGEAVVVVQVGASGYIVAADRTAKPRPIPIQPIGGWTLYSEGIANDWNAAYGESASGMAPALLTGAAASALSNPFYAGITSTGIVTVAGLVTRVGATVTAGEVIATLPLGMRPERMQMFETVDGTNGTAQVYVCPDGTIRIQQITNTGFISLSTITFRAKGYGTWVPLTYINGGANWTGTFVGDTSGVHTAGYTIDSEGVIIFEGMMTNLSGTTAATTNIFQMTALPNFQTMHFPVATGGGFGYVRLGGPGSLTSSAGNYFNIGAWPTGWLSLSGIVIAPQPVGWSWLTPKMLNWADYNGTQYQPHRMGKTPSGLVMLSGLLTPSTLGQSMFFYPRDWWPAYQNLFATANSGLISRTDANSAGTLWGTHQGQIAAATGSNQWHSLDGMNWIAGI